MLVRRPSIVLAFVLVWAVMPASAALATDGLWEISTDTTLTEDHDGAIHIVADGVTLDCDGHTVSDLESDDGVGILLTGVSGVTVKNCNVFGWNFGFVIDDGHNNTIKNSIATGGIDNAFRIAGGSGNTLIGNLAEFSGSHGIELVFTSHNTLLRNTSQDNGVGPDGGAGFMVNDYSHSNVLVDNQAFRNGAGLGVSTSSTNNNFIGNLFVGNVNGVGVGTFSTGNKLINNQVTDNDEIGLLINVESPGTLLVGNTICGNPEVDLQYDEDSEPIVKPNNEICTVFGE